MIYVVIAYLFLNFGKRAISMLVFSVNVHVRVKQVRLADLEILLWLAICKNFKCMTFQS
jgi:hypothetical protein